MHTVHHIPIPLYCRAHAQAIYSSTHWHSWLSYQSSPVLEIVKTSGHRLQYTFVVEAAKSMPQLHNITVLELEKVEDRQKHKYVLRQGTRIN